MAMGTGRGERESLIGGGCRGPEAPGRSCDPRSVAVCGPHRASDTAVLDPRKPSGVLASVRAVLCDSGRAVTGLLTWAQQERTVQSLREVQFDEVRFSPSLPAPTPRRARSSSSRASNASSGRLAVRCVASSDPPDLFGAIRPRMGHQTLVPVIDDGPEPLHRLANDRDGV